MSRSPRLVTLLTYATARGPRHGFRFWREHRLYQKKGFRTSALAVEAGRRERLRVEQREWEAHWGPLRPPRLTWAEALRRYEEAKAGKADLVRHALPRLRWWRQHFEAEGVPEIHLVTPDLVDRAKAALGAAGKQPATVRAYLSVLRAMYSLAIRRWGAVARNPALAVDWPRVIPRAVRVPTVAERRRLFAAAEPTLRNLIIMALLTALRESSLFRLTAEDFRLQPGVFRVIQKGERELWLPLTSQLDDFVRSLSVKSGLLLRWPDGRPMTRFPRKAWERALARARLPWLKFHALRHCASTVMADAGIHQRQIQAYLGHETEAMTRHYTRAVALRPAAEALARGLGINWRTPKRTSTRRK